MTTSRSLSSARAAQASARSRMPRGAVCTPERRRTAAGLPFAAGCSGDKPHATVTSDTPPRACIHACMQIACKRLLSFSLTSVDQRAVRAAAVSFASLGRPPQTFQICLVPVRRDSCLSKPRRVCVCRCVACVRTTRYGPYASCFTFILLHTRISALLTKWRPRTPNTSDVGPFDHT